MSATANIKAGRAYVEVTADSSKLRKSLGEAQAQLRSFSKSCTAMGREMLALGGAMSRGALRLSRSAKAPRSARRPKMSQVSDILTATANGSAQTLTDLFEGLKMAGPQAAAAGESLDELCAALGVMANMGVKGSLAGTALRKAYVQFADVKVQKTLREVGVEATDSSGNLRKRMRRAEGVG